MSLEAWRTLGRSGLIVSPAALGTMTFGNRNWGSADDTSRAIFDAYFDAGGNVIDTADIYSGGRSEELIGSYVEARSLRDGLVIATKFTFNPDPGNPNAGGNGRKNIHRALEGSLRRLRTDYVDLYWMHAYDMVTPVEELLQSLGDLVRAGKIRYFGLSDLPAWYAVRAATLAAAHHTQGPIALQLEYSLVERSIEREHVPAARECGLGIMPWSPLAGGFLTGKYSRNQAAPAGKGRLSGANPFQGPFTKFTDRNWQILDALRAVAADTDRPMSQVALAWAAAQPSVTSLILGARTLDQLRDNLTALELDLAPEQRGRLDQASALDPAFPYGLFAPGANRMLFGGAGLEAWR